MLQLYFLARFTAQLRDCALTTLVVASIMCEVINGNLLLDLNTLLNHLDIPWFTLHHEIITKLVLTT